MEWEACPDKKANMSEMKLALLWEGGEQMDGGSDFYVRLFGKKIKIVRIGIDFRNIQSQAGF